MLGQLLNNCGVTRPHGRLWGWANVAVLYQSDDVWATGLHDSVAEAMEAEPTMNISLSVGINSAIPASSSSAAQFLDSSGYRYVLVAPAG